LACCNSCAKGHACEGGERPWTRLAPVGEACGAPAEGVESRLALPDSPGAGVRFRLEPGSPARVAWKLSMALLEKTVSQAYELRDCTSVRVEVVTFILSGFALGTPTAVRVTLESSIDGENWRPECESVIKAVGYATWLARGLTSRWVRLRYFVSGGPNDLVGVFAATLSGSKGSRLSKARRGAA
jgi:hypothetical protein